MKKHPRKTYSKSDKKIRDLVAKYRSDHAALDARFKSAAIIVQKKHKREQDAIDSRFAKEMESLGCPVVNLTEKIQGMRAFLQKQLAHPIVRDNPKLAAGLKAITAESIARMLRAAI